MAPSQETTTLRVRPAGPDDRSFVLTAARRLADFGPPPWRTAEEVVAAESRAPEAWFDRPVEDQALYIAEDAAGARLGFAYLETLVDFFTRRPHGHVAELAVTREAEGRGAARALLSASEDWARSRGYNLLTLNVFEGNRHARAVYERLGFAAETVRYVKTLD